MVNDLGVKYSTKISELSILARGKTFARFWVFKAVTMKSAVLTDVMMYSMV
jgi:hypothetical protein